MNDGSREKATTSPGSNFLFFGFCKEDHASIPESTPHSGSGTPVKCFVWGVVAYLFGKDGDIFVERLGRADVATGHARFSRSARRQFTFFEYQRQQREQRMPVHTPRYALISASLLTDENPPPRPELSIHQ